MHPILASKRRLGIYLAGWMPIGALLTVLVGLFRGRGWTEAAALAMPLALVYAFICLAAWFVCRSAPIERGGGPRIVLALLVSSACSSALWVFLGKAGLGCLRVR